ncbi:MAG TPA: dihydrodipicolinate reductase C-terminal domain-containing protein [Candidatus Polarisedimenticolaceae bacterium]|nr:dihydrodipicolinate reductase C-terminal domain-containing protein [Candidatus Polarisedimenticolaceae bacterium]
MRYLLVGAGRMGRAIEAEAAGRGHTCVGRLRSVDAARLAPGRVDRTAMGVPEVAFEFTEPSSARRNVLALTGAGVAVVCGTTGWDPDDAFHREIAGRAAGAIVAANFSLGMQLFCRILGHAAGLFAAADSHRPSIFEMHHTGKLDAPSGTARALARILRERDPRLRSVVEGNPERRLPDGALHVASLRVEFEPGTHVVGFDSDHDRIELTHRARGRSGFAAGAVLAGEWIAGKTGLHGFDEVVDELVRAARR